MVRPLHQRNIPAVARLHYDLIGRTGAGSVAALGTRFLESVFYSANLTNPHFFCDVAEVAGEIVGFSVYTDDRTRMFRFAAMLRTVLYAAAHPSAIPVLFRSVTGERAPSAVNGVRGQWIVSAIAPMHRSKGIADNFIESLECRLRAIGCYRWFGAARLDPPINRLLVRHGAKFVGTGTTQGATFNYYVKSVHPM